MIMFRQKLTKKPLKQLQKFISISMRPCKMNQFSKDKMEMAVEESSLLEFLHVLGFN